MSDTQMAANEKNGDKAVSLTPMSVGKSFSLTPTSLAEAMSLAKMIANSDLAPKDFRGKAENCLIAMQMGMEVGLAPMQAIQNIAVINGRPTLWGDAALALVLASPICEYVRENWDEKTQTWTCRGKRRDAKEEGIYSFSLADAEKAGLTKKEGTWQGYRKRMIQMRARAFCLRDNFADVLKGLAIREEVEDYVETSAVENPAPIAMPKAKEPETAPLPPKKGPKEVISAEQYNYLVRMLGQWGVDGDEVAMFIADKFSKKSLNELTGEEAGIVLRTWNTEPPEAK